MDPKSLLRHLLELAYGPELHDPHNPHKSGTTSAYLNNPMSDPIVAATSARVHNSHVQPGPRPMVQAPPNPFDPSQNPDGFLMNPASNPQVSEVASRVESSHFPQMQRRAPMGRPDNPFTGELQLEANAAQPGQGQSGMATPDSYLDSPLTNQVTGDWGGAMNGRSIIPALEVPPDTSSYRPTRQPASAPSMPQASPGPNPIAPPQQPVYASSEPIIVDGDRALQLAQMHEAQRRAHHIQPGLTDRTTRPPNRPSHGMPAPVSSPVQAPEIAPIDASLEGMGQQFGFLKAQPQAEPGPPAPDPLTGTPNLSTVPAPPQPVNPESPPPTMAQVLNPMLKDQLLQEAKRLTAKGRGQVPAVAGAK